ncbi:MAG: protein kinase [Chloroflexi bacterium]|nr:protein kinase [Chloroflexota bacterium]
MFTDSMIGRQLANFRIERIIQRGGMAQVYYGLDVKLQRPVAIKIIDTFYRENPSYARRFIEEARMVATWSHENIIRIYYADDENELYYFVMEYLDGSDLGAVLLDYTRQGMFIPYEEVLRIGQGIAAALDYAHERGVIHRDVKPSNVMIAKDGRVVLMDFGLALSIHGGSIGEAFGTPQYIAPEQANRSADAVPQSDLYSLGVILYELLTGTIPFDDPSAATLVIQHLLHTPPVPSEINPSLHPEVDKVLLKILAKKPADRFQTGSEMMQALEKALLFSSKAENLPALPPMPVGLAPKTVDPLTDPLPEATDKPKKANRVSLQERQFNWLLAGVLVIGLAVILMITWFMWRGFNNEIGEVAAATSTLSASSTPTRLSTPVPATEIAAPIVLTIMHTATSTPSPTITSSPTPTHTATPVPTATPSPTPSMTVPVPLGEGHQIQLFYDESSFYLRNAEAESVSIGLISFESIDSRTGQPAPYLFSGRLWSGFFDALEEGNCVRIETVEGPTWMRPQECAEYNATVTPANEASDLVFWLTRSNVSQFTVLWLGEEVGRCQTHLGVCQVYLPE